jgi:hypothetical protein
VLPKYQLAQLGIGTITGLVLAFTSYYGVLGNSVSSKVAAAPEMGFVVAVIGGYMGTSALDLIARIMFDNSATTLH